MRPVKFPFYVRLALILLSVVLIVMILRLAANIFIPLVFALLISILLFPLNRMLESKLHLGRGLSALLCVLSFVAGLGGFIYFLAFQLISFSGDFPVLRLRFQQMFDSFQHWLSYKFHITSKQQADYVKSSVDSILGSIGHSLSNVVISLTGVLLLTVFVLIFTFFMLYHRRLLMRFVLHLFSVGHREKVHEVIVETKSMINAYVSGLVIEMVVLSIVNCTMFLVMDVKYALLLGIVAAVLNIIPYLGIYTSIVIAMLITLANSTPGMAFEVGASLFVVHLLDSNILFPRIIGGRMKMNPFITIIAVIIGEFVWGIPGMFLFIPITGILKLVCERVEGLEAWGVLIGVEETTKPISKISFRRLKKQAVQEKRP